MQQRGLTSTMESDSNTGDEGTPSPSSRDSRGSNDSRESRDCRDSRGRHNSKLKVLVRSHAMREEASSPPRVPSPNLNSPFIKLVATAEATAVAGNPLVVLSPSISCANSPICVSPSSTLVPSPNSHCASPHHEQSNERLQSASDTEHCTSSSNNSPLKRLNKTNLDKDDTTINTKHPSHLNYNNCRKKLICDCVQQQDCTKCKSQERNINNNLTNLNNNVLTTKTSNTLTVNRVNSKGKLRQQSSGSLEGSSSNSPCLSRDSSSEQYTDTSGIDLELFIPETLNRNAKDRAFMLRIEQELVSLAKDKFKTHFKFPPMSSYQRMLVHRCAAYFGMEHNIESSGKCVVVNKTKNTRIPDTEFKEHIKEDIVFSDEPKRSILKRDSNSMEDYSFKSPDRQISMDRRSKSFEEREEEYEKVRRRIFNREQLCLLRQMQDGGSEDFEWTELPWSSTDSDPARFRLQLPESRRHFGRLIKVQSEETGDTLRPFVAKSFSFGGYGGVLNRGDSVISTHSAGPRLLTKQDSAASSVSWRLSPSSSGYKSQSQMSESVTPSPTSTPHPIGESTRQDSDDLEKEALSQIVWAVTNMESVPKGSLIINPQTGEPYKNDDGSLYHYDPHNPPAGFANAPAKPPPSPKKQSPVKKKTIKSSPSRKSNFTNSSTSPSLPYSPPLQANKNIQFISGMGENMPPISSQYPIYGGGYSPSHEVSVYQQPYIVYTTPYGVPPFDGRMEPPPPPPLAEIPGTVYMNVPDSNASGAPVAYPANPNYWNQQPIYYQNPPNPSPQRFPVPVQSQNYISATYPPSTNYIQQNPPAPPTPNNDLLPVYHHPVLYTTNNTPFVYHNVYQNPVYTNPVFPQNYPQSASTPNSCSSLPYSGHIQDNFVQLTQNMAQMNLQASQPPPALPPPTHHHHQQQQQQHQQQQQQQGFIYNNNNNNNVNSTNHNNINNNKMIPPPHFDVRPQQQLQQQQQQQQQKHYTTPKGNKFNGSKFIVGSSQSSTGTNSPATTVVAAGYYPPPLALQQSLQQQQQQQPLPPPMQNQGIFRTPPSTPPNQFNYGPNFAMPPMLFRQMNNVRANTPGTARSSRSPTPASDISHFERQRISFPTTLYHGMPYVLQSDGRMMSGRNQFYRQTTPNRQQNFSQQGSDNRSQKFKKSKGKQSNRFTAKR